MKNFIEKTYNIMWSKNHPVSIVHFVTNKCNARCPHCFIDFKNPIEQKSFMPLEDIEQLSKTMGNQLMNVSLTGGEPFLRKDLIDIARLYYKNTLIDSLVISTHGGMSRQIIKMAQIIAKEFPDRKLIFSISVDHFPEKHNHYRRIKNLFENALFTYEKLNQMKANILVNIAITVSPENRKIVLKLYDYLKSVGVESVTAILVRDEGVYKTPVEMKKELIAAYSQLNNKIHRDLKNDVIKGYNPNIYLGRMINKKNQIMNKNIQVTYINNEFISPCRSGALFGVLYPNGDVYPCEILGNKKMGNVYEHSLNFLNLWDTQAAQEIRKWVVQSKCRCTYECAWNWNILGNRQYLPQMVKSFLF